MRKTLTRRLVSHVQCMFRGALPGQSLLDPHLCLPAGAVTSALKAVSRIATTGQLGSDLAKVQLRTLHTTTAHTSAIQPDYLAECRSSLHSRRIHERYGLKVQRYLSSLRARALLYPWRRISGSLMRSRRTLRRRKSQPSSRASLTIPWTRELLVSTSCRTLHIWLSRR